MPLFKKLQKKTQEVSKKGLEAGEKGAELGKKTVKKIKDALEYPTLNSLLLARATFLSQFYCCCADEGGHLSQLDD